jgi:DNA-binding response OmpR family regulator
MHARPDLQTEFPGARVLIVDDEHALLRTLEGFLESVGYRLSTVPSGIKALELLAKDDFDVMLLDLQMPGMNGTDVLRLAKSVAPETSIIIMTAYGTLESAIAGIRHGAFEYLLKPCPIREIVRTVEACLSEQKKKRDQIPDPIERLEQVLADLKSGPASPSEEKRGSRFLQVDDLTVDTQKRWVIMEDRPVDLTPTEYEILVYLVQHRDHVVSASELVEHLRGYEMEDRDAQKFLHSHIYRLRQKIEQDSSEPRYICTVRGQGYCLPTNNLDAPPMS